MTAAAAAAQSSEALPPSFGPAMAVPSLLLQASFALVLGAVAVIAIVARQRAARRLDEGIAAVRARRAEERRITPRSWPCGCEYDPDLGWHECSHHHVVGGVRLTKAPGADPLEQPTDRTPPQEPRPVRHHRVVDEPSLLDVQRRPKGGAGWAGTFDPPRPWRTRVRRRRGP